MKTTAPILGLTAEDLMSRVEVTIPQHMPMWEAAQLFHQAKSNSVPVVDETGMCVGFLSNSDVLRWSEEGSSCAEADRIPSCYYQTKGLVPGSPEVVTCTLAEGSCQLQMMQSTSEDRRVALCRDPNCFCCESQLVDVPGSRDEANRYMTTELVTTGLRTPLSELTRMMNDSRTERILVIDDCGRPAGFVSSTKL